MKKCTFLFLFLICIAAFGQSPIAEFSVQSAGCLQESIEFVNASQHGSQYDWDFCEQDFLSTPIFTDRGVMPGVTTALDIRFFEDAGNWFAFVCDADGSKVDRLNFGDDITNTPSFSSIGNFTTPSGIEIVQIDGIWYGLVGTFNLPSRLFLLNFGGSLSNDPVISEVILPANTLVSPRSIRLVNDNGIYTAFIANWSQASITRLIFGSSLGSSVQQIDQLNFGVSGLLGLEAKFDGTTNYLYVTARLSNTIYRLDFGASWVQTPVATIVNTPPITNPSMLQIEYEGGNYHGMLIANNGQLYRINFGSDLANLNPITEDLGFFSGMSNVWGMDLGRVNGHFSILLTSLSTNKLFQIELESNSCSSNVAFYRGETPPFLKYETAGVYMTTLRIKNDKLQEDVISKPITITAQNAPQLVMSTLNKQCLGENNVFSYTSDLAISSTVWDFGDGQGSTENTTEHSYASPGSYTYSLSVTASNGCGNRMKDSLSIFFSPSFAIPPISVICTNESYTFTNSTVFDNEASPNWLWSVDDVNQVTSFDFTYLFNETSPVIIKLKASNNQCSGEFEQTIASILAGPTIDFTIDGACLNESVQLTNNSQGDIAGYTWNFGDGQSSSDANPIVNYAAAGNYVIELQALGANGCLSTKSLPHQIYSVPVPNFNTDLPPFSCNGTPTQFNDLTPPLTDSNINTWQWSFDDQNASASTQNPQHTYALSGNYNVSLTVTSDQLCAATLNKTISIAQSPSPSITNTAACVETAVVLQETATTTANAWQWQIGNNFYFTASPSHVFSNPGTYQVSLTLTASNGCVGTTTKQINVPAPLAIDFESALNCVSTPTQFTSLVNDDLDPVLTYNWNFGTEQKSGPVVNFLYNQSGIKEVQLTALATSGCFYTITKAIDILPEPKADFSFTPSSGPPPLVVSFTNESTDANTFAWKFNDLNNTISTLNNPSFTFTEVGEYAVDLTASNTVGCESTVSKLITIAFPFLNATLDNFRIIRNTDGSYLLLTNILNNGNVLVQNPLIEIQLDNTTTLQEIVNRSILPGGLIDYTFATQISNVSNLNYACVRLLLPNNEALNNTEACLTFNANTAMTSPYPNPASNSITVEWISPEDEQVAMTVVDNLGNVMATENISSKQGLNTLVLQTMDWQAGIYFIRLKSPSKAHYFRTIIAR